MRESESVHARAPLCVAADGDDEWTIRGIEQLIRDEIGMRIPPAFCIEPGNQNVLSDVD